MQCKLSKDGKSVNVGVHRVVAMAFLENPDNKPEVNHKDGNRRNNCASNLEWVTHVENIADSIARGTHISFCDLSGSNNPNYGNRKLHDKYAENPELAIVQSRPGALNGRAKPVRVVLPDGTIEQFGYIGECANWLIANQFVSIKQERMSLIIKRCASDGSAYKNLLFEFI